MNQNELMELCVNSSNAAVYLKDEQGRFLMVNQQVADMFGTSIDELIGKNDYDYVNKEEADRFRQYDREVAATGEPLTVKVSATFQGQERTFIDHKFPVTGVEGAESAVGGVAIDITKL